MKNLLITQAASAMAAFPQYAGRFDNMKLALALKTVRTKAGIAVEAGDFVLFETGESPKFVTIWSARNACLTSVPARAVKAVS